MFRKRDSDTRGLVLLRVTERNSQELCHVNKAKDRVMQLVLILASRHAGKGSSKKYPQSLKKEPALLLLVPGV